MKFSKFSYSLKCFVEVCSGPFGFIVGGQPFHDEDFADGRDITAIKIKTGSSMNSIQVSWCAAEEGYHWHKGVACMFIWIPRFIPLFGGLAIILVLCNWKTSIFVVAKAALDNAFGQ